MQPPVLALNKAQQADVFKGDNFLDTCTQLYGLLADAQCAMNISTIP